MRFLVSLDVHGCADKVVDLWLARLSCSSPDGDEVAPHTKVDLLTVVPRLDGARGVSSLVVGDRAFELGGVLDDETAALLRAFAVLLQKNHVLGEVIARNGAPVEQILSVCQQRGPEMVIMGSHARTGLARAVFGSVAESVLRQSRIPVLIEPRRRRRAGRAAEANA